MKGNEFFQELKKDIELHEKPFLENMDQLLEDNNLLFCE